MAEDKRLAVTYVPPTGTESRRLGIDLAQFAGPMVAHWYNPTNGHWTKITDEPLANQSVRKLQTPGDNGTKTNDWLLALEAANSSK
jgi:hypothetical protein